MKEITTLGVDLAKSLFTVHGVDSAVHSDLSLVANEHQPMTAMERIALGPKLAEQRRTTVSENAFRLEREVGGGAIQLRRPLRASQNSRGTNGCNTTSIASSRCVNASSQRLQHLWRVPASLFHAGADALPVPDRVERVLAAMPPCIAVPARGSDVVRGIAAAVLASLQMLRRTAQ
jgi:hypothetical protein